MKKLIRAFIIILMVLFFTGNMTTFANSGVKMPNDIENHWAKEYIEKIVKMGAINGYPDGSFKPDNPITRAEFTKILVCLVDSNVREMKEKEQWHKRYFEKALSIGTINDFDMSRYYLPIFEDEPITRGLIAKQISTRIKDIPADVDDYKYQLLDMDYRHTAESLSADTEFNKRLRDSLQVDQNEPIALLYRLGIITGYPNHKFEKIGKATRAEAAVMLMRWLEKDLRKVPTQETSMLRIRENYDDVIIFNVTLYIDRPLEIQYKECEEYLIKKLGVDLTSQIMPLVKSKTGQGKDIYVDFKWGTDKVVTVDSNTHLLDIEIYAQEIPR